MIRDTLLICCIVICLVLFYRMYVLNQKINNLEEKVSVIDNFSQSIFNFITSKEEAKEVKEVTYSNNLPNEQKLSVIQEEETETETESEPNAYNTNNLEKDERKSENMESKEVLSEMVAELKESLIKSNKETLENELNQVQELKQELKQKSDETSNDTELFNLLNSVSTDNISAEVKIMDTPVQNVQVENNLKKKEEDLNKMNLNDLKALAKKKNIPVMISNKNKKKEVLIQDLLKVM